MTQIKSKDAKSYLSSTAMHPNSPLAQDQYLVWRESSILESILIAEKEAEERHAKELQELRDYIESILEVISNADYLCEVKRFVELNANFTQKLTKK